MSRPVIRLKPRTDPRALRQGFPWVYADQLVTDRRTRTLAPGTLAVLEDGTRTPIGLATLNPASKIIARVLDRDPEARLSQDWFAARLERALALRAQLYDSLFYRLVHAEADGLPGVVIDRFADLAVIQPNAAWAEAHMDILVAALEEVTGIRRIVHNGTGRARALEGLPEDLSVLRGSVEGPVEVPMNGAIYLADVLGGQKTGLFYDQRPNHAFAARLACNGGTVLDVFSHVGGFALAALAAGAGHAVLVDSSAPALELAADAAARADLTARFETRRGDAFAQMEALAAETARFDMVVCDPPAFAPHRGAVEAGLRAYEKVARLAALLVAPGGYLVLCSCSHAVDLSAFRSGCARGIGRAGRSGQILHTGFAGPDHPQLPQLAESGYLKALFWRLDG